MSLQAMAWHAGNTLEGAHPVEVLRWADDTFGSRFVITSSMGDGLLASLAAEVRPGIDVVFLDTGYHFPETLGTRDAVAATLPVRLLTVTPVCSVAEQDADLGPRLFERDPDLCCALRKVAPLERALTGYAAWASGVRRDEGVSRAGTRAVEWDPRRKKVKINPLVCWNQEQVDDWVVDHGVIVNPLVEEGYASIGCAPCTRRVAAGQDARAGRWSGTTKTECGLHV